MTRMLMTVVVFSSVAGFAQEAPPPDAADAGVPAATPVARQPLATPPAAPESLPAPAAPPALARPSAHERRRGSVGFGFLGTTPVLTASPQPTFDPLTGRATSVIVRASVPMLGLRWWTRHARLGVEAGTGVMVSGGEGEQVTAGGLQMSSAPTTLEWVGHVALPVMLGSTEHVIVFIAPEARVGYSSRKVGMGSGTPDHAWTFDLSAKAGVEIFFSFLGLDNLSLEAGVRAGLTHEVRKVTISTPLQPEESATSTATRFATSLVANPWDLFTSTLAARYYF